jgi:hypothetical protein
VKLREIFDFTELSHCHHRFVPWDGKHFGRYDLTTQAKTNMKFNFSARLLTAAAIAFAGAAIAPSNAFAATQATVNVGGAVAQTLDIQSTTAPGAGNLDLTSAGAKQIKVADVAINTNNSTGYTLTINDGSMIRTGEAGSTPIAFQVLTVADAAAVPAEGAFAAGTHTFNSGAANAVGISIIRQPPCRILVLTQQRLR